MQDRTAQGSAEPGDEGKDSAGQRKVGQSKEG